MVTRCRPNPSPSSSSHRSATLVPSPGALAKKAGGHSRPSCSDSWRSGLTASVYDRRSVQAAPKPAICSQQTRSSPHLTHTERRETTRNDGYWPEALSLRRKGMRYNENCLVGPTPNRRLGVRISPGAPPFPQVRHGLHLIHDAARGRSAAAAAAAQQAGQCASLRGHHRGRGPARS